MVSLLFLPSCNTPPLKKKTTIPVGAGALYNVLYREAAPEVQRGSQWGSGFYG